MRIVRINKILKLFSLVFLIFSLNINSSWGMAYTGQTALHFACIDGNMQNCKKLIESGSDVNAVDVIGDTPLHEACLNGNLDICKLLVLSGADINAVNSSYFTLYPRSSLYDRFVGDWPHISKNTPLHIACMNGNLEICKLLIESGANVNAINQKGKTPFARPIKYLDRCLATFEPILIYCARLSRSDICKLLVERCIDVNQKNSEQDSALHIACMNGNLEICQLLIANGADVNATNFIGDTPLHEACISGSLEICELLIESGANVNVVNKLIIGLELEFVYGDVRFVRDYNHRAGNTPLHFACQFGHLNICVLLIKNHADATMQNGNGNAPFFMLSMQHRKFLLSYIHRINFRSF